MFARLLVLLFVISAASAASLHPANIPVRILYEEPRAKNLLEEAPVLGHLDEKPQLSLEERREQVKHHPQEQLTPNQLLNQAQSYVDQFLDSNKPQGASVQDAFLEFTRNVNELLELVFRKTDETPWGFRLAGGSDCDLPLFVSKVLSCPLNPSTIQETLDAVTQQLKKIVVEKLHYEESPEASEEEQPPTTPPPPLEEETVLEEPEPP